MVSSQNFWLDPASAHQQEPSSSHHSRLPSRGRSAPVHEVLAPPSRLPTAKPGLAELWYLMLLAVLASNTTAETHWDRQSPKA
jgi:hypothetical protein